MLGEDGLAKRIVCGPAPANLPQTPISAEWCAASVTTQLVVAATDLAQDCKGVVVELQKPQAKQLRPTSIHVGHCRVVATYLLRKLVSARWIRGHVAESALDEEKVEERRDARANDLADMYAKFALSTHPRLTQALLADVLATLRLAASLLPLWPRIGKAEIELAKAEPPFFRKRAAKKRLAVAHVWEKLWGKW